MQKKRLIVLHLVPTEGIEGMQEERIKYQLQDD